MDKSKNKSKHIVSSDLDKGTSTNATASAHKIKKVRVHKTDDKIVKDDKIVLADEVTTVNANASADVGVTADAVVTADAIVTDDTKENSYDSTKVLSYLTNAVTSSNLIFADKININVLSSLLFAVPGIFAYSVSGASRLTIACFLCLLTSVANHYLESTNIWLQLIDRITLSSIAAYFTIQCITQHGCQYYACWMYLFGLGALATFYYLWNKPQLYHKYYFMVHVLACTGIMFYVQTTRNC